MSDTLNIKKRKIFKRRRDGQVAQNGSVSVSLASGSSGSGGDFNPAVLQDYAKKVDVHTPGQKPLLDALSVQAGYMKYSNTGLSVENADQLGGIVAASYARRDVTNTYAAAQTINSNLYVNGDIIHRGAAYTADFEQVKVQNNLMQLNVSEPGSQITGVIPGTSIPFSGLEINRGTPDPYYLGVVEGASPLLKLGKKESLVTIAARADSISDGYAMQWDNTSKMIIGVAAVRDSLKLGGVEASNYARTDIEETFERSITQNSGYFRLRPFSVSYGNKDNEELRLYYDSNDNRLVFQPRSGTSYDTADNNVELKFEGAQGTGYFKINATGGYINNSTIYHAGNSNLSTVDWSAKTLDVYSELKFHSGYKIQSYNGQILKINALGNNVDIFSGRFIVKSDGTETTGNATVSGYLGSPSYKSGFGGHGWRTDAAGNATFDSITVRKTFNVYELNVNKIRSGNGSYWFSDGAKITNAYIQSSPNCWIISFDNETGNPFALNDVVRCQVWTGSGIKYWCGKIGWISGTTVAIWPNDMYEGAKSSDPDATTNPSRPQAGDEIVRIGNTTDANRQGAVYITSNDNDAPYIDVLDGVNSDSFAGKIKVRLGKLNGITSPTFGNLNGYGFWTQNGYLEGGINAKFGKIGGWNIHATKIWAGTEDNGDIEMNLASMRFLVRKNGSNYVMMNYSNANSWGIHCYNTGSKLFELGSTNQIAGWVFDHEKLYNGNMYLHKTGGIYAYKSGGNYWHLKNDGSGLLASGNISWDTSGNVTFGSSAKLQWEEATTNKINYAKDRVFSDGVYNEYISDSGATGGTAVRIWRGWANHTYWKTYWNNIKVGSTYRVFVRCRKVGTLGGSGIQFGFYQSGQPSYNFNITSKVTETYQVIDAGTFTPEWSQDANPYLWWLNTSSFSPNDGSNNSGLYVDYIKIVEASLNEGDITTIANNTISTTNVLAQNLRVKAAHIDGVLTASQVNFNGAMGNNVDLTGRISASGGSFGDMFITPGGFELSDDSFFSIRGGTFSFEASTVDGDPQDWIKLTTTGVAPNDERYLHTEISGDIGLLGRLSLYEPTGDDWGVFSWSQDLILSWDRSLYVEGSFNYGASDRYFKENIKNVKNALSKLRKLKPKTFTWKNNCFGEGVQHGFIAQDVLKVFPEIVDKRPDGKLRVHYDSLISENTASILELDKLLNNTIREIQNIKSHLNML